MGQNIPFVLNSDNSLLKSFIEKFTQDEFFVDLIKLILYPADFGSINSNRIVDYLRSFLNNINLVVRKNQYGLKSSTESIQIVNSLLNIRESHENILSYDNVFQHLGKCNLYTQQLIQKAIDEKHENPDDFRRSKEQILLTTQAYYEIYSVSGNIKLLDILTESISKDTVPVFEALRNYKEVIISAYNDLSKLQSLNKEESISDYFILSDNSSAEKFADTLFKYTTTNYGFYKTGYKIFDQTLDGIESSSVHIISAPSNHGKSIFMINLTNTIIRNNLMNFNKDDAILFLTLEDDIYKLFRRFASISGNYNYNSIKSLFKTSYEISNYENAGSYVSNIKNMFKNIIQTSILDATDNKVSLIIKHSNENTFSSGDISRFIDQVKVEGINIKAIIVDYIDVMVPIINKFTSGDDYNAQGLIVQEMRNLSRLYQIPVITATQNRRESENVSTAMSNMQIGDSYKKVRNADFIYMCRMRSDLDIFNSPVKENVLSSGINMPIDQKILSMSDKVRDQISFNLVPFEVKITKAKDSEKGANRFLLFCKQNLKIYNNLQEYLDDINQLINNSNKLTHDIKVLSSMALASSIQSDEIEQNEDPFGISEQECANSIPF